MVSISDSTAMLISVVSVVSAVATAAYAFKRNTSGVSNDVITTYRERVKQLEERVSTCEGLHRNNLEEMGKMKGAMSTMESLLKDRNPETTSFMEYLTRVAKQSEIYMANTAALPETMKSISDFMAEIAVRLSNPAKKKKIR